MIREKHPPRTDRTPPKRGIKTWSRFEGQVELEQKQEMTSGLRAMLHTSLQTCFLVLRFTARIWPFRFSVGPGDSLLELSCSTSFLPGPDNPLRVLFVPSASLAISARPILRHTPCRPATVTSDLSSNKRSLYGSVIGTSSTFVCDYASSIAHILMVLSSEPDTICSPSVLIVTEFTAPE